MTLSGVTIAFLSTFFCNATYTAWPWLWWMTMAAAPTVAARSVWPVVPMDVGRARRAWGPAPLASTRPRAGLAATGPNPSEPWPRPAGRRSCPRKFCARGNCRGEPREFSSLRRGQFSLGISPNSQAPVPRRCDTAPVPCSCDVGPDGLVPQLHTRWGPGPRSPTAERGHCRCCWPLPEHP